MPANLPPQYAKAEEQYRAASTPAARLEAVREMYRLLPKHKGTEKLQSDLKQRISRLRDEIEQARHAGKKGGISYRVPHEGAGQYALVGPPNAGKSALLGALTRARPEVAAYPFTTRLPQPGMMAWEDVAVQLVDLPAVTAEFVEPWAVNIIRSADGAVLVADLADEDLLETTEAVLARLARLHTELVGQLPDDGGDEAVRHLPTVMAANKLDAAGASDRLALVREYYGDRYPILAVSAVTGAGLDQLRETLYRRLGVIRVYTKVPGRPADRSHPYTLPEGATVADLARSIHNDLERGLKYARVWGQSAFEGQSVGRDHRLHDGDVVELHSH
ncbi:MAG: GTP-binding protein [Isosphaeraceae bacterium]|jgi:ribosome-interacting GTPase 1|nr:MAG: GTP-binding protein [Isosphaeraceae bacterium]